MAVITNKGFFIAIVCSNVNKMEKLFFFSTMMLIVIFFLEMPVSFPVKKKRKSKFARGMNNIGLYVWMYVLPKLMERMETINAQHKNRHHKQKVVLYDFS